MDMLTCFGKNYKYLTLLTIIGLAHPLLANAKLIDVKIGLIESLSPVTPSTSDRYKSLNESAIYYALGENEKKLHRCGYNITMSTSYFDTFDALQLVKDAKTLENSNTWAIIGPRKSSHFITAAQEIKTTPMISTMANSHKAYELGKHTYSMYPRASSLANLMVNEIVKLNYGGAYGTVVDVRCDNCIDFAKSFKLKNSKNKEAFYLEVADNVPNLKQLKDNLTKHKVDYLLLPNYSELSGYIIAEISKTHPTVKYVGADGWGEHGFSYINGCNIQNSVKAMSIRAGMPDNDKNNYFKVYSLDSEVNGIKIKPPYSVYALVELIRILSDDLCQSKAKNKHEFSTYMSQQSAAHFQRNIPYCIYEIKDGQMTFSYYVHANEKE